MTSNNNPAENIPYDKRSIFELRDEIEDLEVLLAVARRDRKRLHELESFKPRRIIEKLKNEPKDLDYFLSFYKDVNNGRCDPGAGSYFYTNVKSNKTFLIYRKYNIAPCNLYRELVTPEQWKYLRRIGYISAEQYRED